MPQIDSYIRYFRDCYLEDTRTIGLNNFFSAKAEKRALVTDKEELISGDLPYIPVDPNWAQEVSKVLETYQRERSLYYGAFFLTGITGEQKQKRCAPLFLFPATIFRQGEHDYLRVAEVPLINWAVFSTYRSPKALESEDWLDKIPSWPYDFAQLGALRRWVDTYFEGFSTEELLYYPSLSSEKELKSRLRSSTANEERGLSLMAAAGMCIMRKSSATLGINADLLELSGQHSFSDPLQVLFGKAGNSFLMSRSAPRTPAVLSAAQESVIDAARRHPLSLAIGPPGTGKSFTIANLAISEIAKGRSVLICTRSEEALDVIQEKLARLGFGNVSNRIGKGDQLKAIKKDLSNLLSGIMPIQLDELEAKLDEDARVPLASLSRQLAQAEKDFVHEVENELSWGEKIKDWQEDPGFWNQLKYQYVTWRNEWQEPLWTILQRLEKLERARTARYQYEIAHDYLSHLRKCIRNDRRTLGTFLKAIRARTSSRREDMIAQLNWGSVLQALPLWLCPMADIHLGFPQHAGLFDVVIIDEATQCDTASALPLLQRAKRAVLFGDPRQLRHVSFLSGAQLRRLASKHTLTEEEGITLDYRNDSILDFVQLALKEEEAVNFLDEHFRSLPPIIAFSNKHFYGGQLRIMTHKPGVLDKPALFAEQTGGRLSPKGYNQAEADALLSRISTQIEAEKHLPPAQKSTIGVLAIFRNQLEYLQERLLKEIPAQAREEHALICGTAYAFQGAERDIMLLSLSLDDTASASAFRYLNREDVLNVAITRARGLQYIYHSFDPRQGKRGLIARYLEHIEYTQQVKEKERALSVFRDEVISALEDRGWQCWPSFENAGMELDIVAGKEGRLLGIDLIGYPDQLGEAFSLSRYKILARAGMPCFPLPYTDWHFDRESCLHAIDMAAGFSATAG